MIIAAWRRWVDSGQWWWLAVLAGVLLADVVIGSWLLAYELELLKEYIRP